MSSNSSITKRLKALAKEIPDEPKIRGMLRLIEQRHLGSDYAVALMGASLIERALDAAILSRFVILDQDGRNRLFDYTHQGPLADFAARSRMGAALGLYGRPTFEDLEKIRNVRNLFAHSASLRKFSEQPIAQACSQFSVLDHVFRHRDDSVCSNETPKAAYVSACLQISGRLRARLQDPDETNPIRFPVEDGALP